MPRPDSLTVTILLAALVAFGAISTDLYLPSLPTIGADFGADPGTVQLTLSVFLAGFAVSQLVYGPLSDRFGRRPALLGGLALYAAASVACLVATSIEQLIAARFFQAVGACCGPVVGRAVVRDVHGPGGAARILAYLAMAMAVAPAVGPILGGILTEASGWRASFAVLAGFGTLVLLGVWRLLGETNRAPDPDALRPRRLAANYLGLFRHRRYVGFVLCAAFAYSGIFAFISGSSFVLVDGLGLRPTAYGACFGAAVVGYMIGSFAAGRLTLRLGVERMVLIGSSVGLAGGLLGAGLALAGVATVASIVGPAFVFFLAAGLTLPNAMAGAIGPFPRMAGLASALLGFTQMAVASLVGLAVGQSLDGSPLPMMAAIAAVSAGAGLAYWTLVRGAASPAESLPVSAVRPD